MKAEMTDCDYNYGEPLDQVMAGSGLLQDRKLGMPSLTAKDLQSETVAQDKLRSPDGTNTSVGARLLYPQMILETMQEHLQDDGSDILAKYAEMVAVTRNVGGKKVDQPLINTKAPEGSRSGEIAELAEPETMVTITTGDRSYRIPTKSIGLTISDEAMESTTIDLVRVVMEAQARGERIAMVEDQLRALVLGDKDRGIEALPVKAIGSFDAAITGNGQITKKAYIKWLRENYRLREISHVMTDLDTVLDIDDQLLPKMTGMDSSRIMTPFSGMNLDIPVPKMVDFSQDVFGAGMLVGLDRRNAIQRFVNVNANYEGIENYVMRRANSFRVDYGEMATRLYDEAWSVVGLTQS
jgi:predicted HAD superfamily phosphohydrolase YqeG